MRRLIMVITGLLVALGLAVPTAGAAAPGGRARLSLTLSSSQVTASAPFAASVGSSGLRGARVRLQRTAGTSHIWQTVKSMPKRGTATVPGVAMGSYSYRVVAIKRHRITAKSAARTLYSYGSVSAYSLCLTASRTRQIDNGCNNTETIQVGSQVYEWASFGFANNPESADAAVRATHSSCRSLNISVAVRSSDTQVSQFGAALSTTNSDIQQIVGTRGQILHATFNLTSPSWNLIAWDDHGGVFSSDTFWNGTFSCWTPTGNY